MARKLASFEEGGYKSVNRSKYPWSEWEDGDIWEIEQGTDFLVDQKDMASGIYMRGRKVGKKVRVHRQGTNKLAFQFYDVE